MAYTLLNMKQGLNRIFSGTAYSHTPVSQFHNSSISNRFWTLLNITHDTSKTSSWTTPQRYLGPSNGSSSAKVVSSSNIPVMRVDLPIQSILEKFSTSENLLSVVGPRKDETSGPWFPSQAQKLPRPYYNPQPCEPCPQQQQTEMPTVCELPLPCSDDESNQQQQPGPIMQGKAFMGNATTFAEARRFFGRDVSLRSQRRMSTYVERPSALIPLRRPKVNYSKIASRRYHPTTLRCCSRQDDRGSRGDKKKSRSVKECDAKEKRKIQTDGATYADAERRYHRRINKARSSEKKCSADEAWKKGSCTGGGTDSCSTNKPGCGGKRSYSTFITKMDFKNKWDLNRLTWSRSIKSSAILSDENKMIKRKTEEKANAERTKQELKQIKECISNVKCKNETKRRLKRKKSDLTKK